MKTPSGLRQSSFLEALACCWPTGARLLAVFALTMISEDLLSCDPTQSRKQPSDETNKARRFRCAFDLRAEPRASVAGELVAVNGSVAVWSEATRGRAIRGEAGLRAEPRASGAGELVAVNGSVAVWSEATGSSRGSFAARPEGRRAARIGSRRMTAEGKTL